MILIITHSSDLAADLVIRHLHARAKDYIRVDSNELGTPKHHFGFRDGRPSLMWLERNISVDEVSSTWARRFARPSILEKTDPRYETFVARELNCVMEAFLECVTGRQINTYDADRRSGNRLYQATVARSVGFLVPETLVTQNVAGAKKFAAEHGDVISKAISFGALDVDGTVAYTSRVTNESEFGGVASCPTLLQTAIPKKYEWRVTNVGKVLFSARTRSDAAIDSVDWRRSQNIMEVFEQAELPPEIAAMIRSLCKLSSIQFGSHDLVETPAGEFYFLETNPAGQWGWLELGLGMSIGESLALLLCAVSEE